MMSKLELFGMCGSILILISMLYKSDTVRGNVIMRFWNLAGSIIFVVYGLLLPSYCTVLLNVIAVVVHIYYLVAIYRRRR